MSITDQTRKVKTRNALAKIRKPNQVEIPRVECFSAPSFWLAAPPVPASSGQSRKIGWHRGSNPGRGHCEPSALPTETPLLDAPPMSITDQTRKVKTRN